MSTVTNEGTWNFLLSFLNHKITLSGSFYKDHSTIKPVHIGHQPNERKCPLSTICLAETWLNSGNFF